MIHRPALLTGILVALILGWSSAALAWGKLGHRIIADIALANVSPHTRQLIDPLIKASPALDTPDCPIQSLADAAVWPDCLRGEHGPQAQRWRPSFRWHYQDSPACAVDFNPAAACPGGACVTAQIEIQRRILADRHRSTATRLQALAFLTHFIGDVHQPLHTVDDNDRGGNDEIISNIPPGSPYGDAPPRPVSLHGFWDTTLVHRALAPPMPSLVRRYSPATRARLATGRPVDWARESWQIAVKIAYPQAMGGRMCSRTPPARVIISPHDQRSDLLVVRERLIQAGLRLARVLDATLGN